MIKLKTPNELNILKQFQDRVSDLNPDEATCTRFLIAREFKIDAAEEMFRKNVEWRRHEEIEGITKWDPLPAYCVEDLPYAFTGRSLSGGPVIWMPLGVWKARYWVEQGKKDEITRYVYHILEKVLFQVKKNGNIRATIIFGIEELTYWKVSHMDTLRLLYDGFRTLEQNYPEILENLFVVNAPWAFTIAFNFIKPILSEHTLNKFKIHGTDSSQWLPKLKELVEEDSIPAQYLASRTN